MKSGLACIIVGCICYPFPDTLRGALVLFGLALMVVAEWGLKALQVVTWVVRLRREQDDERRRRQ